MLETLNAVLRRYFGDPGNFELEDYLHAFGDPRQAILMFPLFYPDMVEVAGHPVLRSFINSDEDEVELRNRLASEQHVQAILSSYRFAELPYLFRADFQQPSDWDVLAEIVMVCWRASLVNRYPNRKWVTGILTPQETGDQIAVYFSEAAA